MTHYIGGHDDELQTEDDCRQLPVSAADGIDSEGRNHWHDGESPHHLVNNYGHLLLQLAEGHRRLLIENSSAGLHCIIDRQVEDKAAVACRRHLPLINV